jgi:phytoene/squalene synthetase
LQVPDFPKNLSEADIYSYKKLVKVSRSFAAVIAELPEDLRRPVRALPRPRPIFPRIFIRPIKPLTPYHTFHMQIANFYLVLRGLDTVEDDMSIPLEKKVHDTFN